MKTPAFKFFVLAIATFTFISCSSDSSDDGIFDENIVIEEEIIEEQVKSTYEYSAIESEILELVNKHRKSIGIPELIALDFVSEVAADHTKYMIEVGKISHDNFSERSKKLIENAEAKSVGENVAYGYTTAETAVNGWLNSDGHRGIIEDAKFTHFGISTDTNNVGRNFYTQIFITK